MQLNETIRQMVRICTLSRRIKYSGSHTKNLAHQTNG